jgi:hypothetical protein
MRLTVKFLLTPRLESRLGLKWNRQRTLTHALLSKASFAKRNVPPSTSELTKATESCDHACVDKQQVAECSAGHSNQAGLPGEYRPGRLRAFSSLTKGSCNQQVDDATATHRQKSGAAESANGLERIASMAATRMVSQHIALFSASLDRLGSL